MFLSNEDIFPRLKLFFIHPNEKVPACVKTKVVNSACYKFLVFLVFHNDFMDLDKMHENIQGVEHDL